MDDADLEWIACATSSQRATRRARIQSVWAGYGEIVRVDLAGGEVPSVVVKRVLFPPRATSSFADARKRSSYENETAFYRGLAGRCDDACRVARLLASRDDERGRLLVLEDLDASGFTRRMRDATRTRDLDMCLAWLAAFHARFLGVRAPELWEVGTYWHLTTRPDELAKVADDALREAAPRLDATLSGARFQTLVHGDAKEENFCFGEEAVAAVDFQYVGGGPGIRDVAYLLTGRSDEDEAMDRYFSHLRAELARREERIDVAALEAEWRALFWIASADFQRFLAGWAPEHYARDARAQRVVRRVIGELR